jgi:hypothetical protein
MRLCRCFLCLVTVLCGLLTANAQVAQSKSLQPRRKGKSVVRPLKNGRALLPAIQTQSATGTTIPLWNYSLVSPVDNTKYSGNMVGRSPFAHGFRSTSVQAYLIPVIMKFSDGTVLDPTAPDPCNSNLAVSTVTANSPVFQNAAFTLNGVGVGTTQYIDAFQRANFWTNVSLTGNRYHTLLNLTTLPAVNVTVPAADGGATNLGIFFCTWGDIDINWFDSVVQNTLLPNLAAQGVAPNTLPIFLFDSVNMCDPYNPNNVPCGILGYHSAYTPSTLLQTYVVSDFDTSGLYSGDVSVLTHEVGEWMDDPMGTNFTPLWGNTGQVVGCQNNLEVGDPLTGTILPPVTMNGFTYSLQELVFFSWFFRQSPSLGTGGKYSDNGTFTSGAGPVC